MARARRLSRSGKSRQAIAANLAARGVAKAAIQQVLPADEEAELAAAVAFARRRRIGPFRSAQIEDESQQRREFAAFARAGFSQRIAAEALRLDNETAATLLRRLSEA